MVYYTTFRKLGKIIENVRSVFAEGHKKRPVSQPFHINQAHLIELRLF